jgi:hypothetical protein
MPKTILQKIKDIEADPALVREVQRQAIDIILDAVGTSKWEDFIRNFVDNENPHQLARLRLKDEAGTDPYIRQTVAYLIANPTCGMDTPMRLHENIDELLDIDIPYDSAPAGEEDSSSLTEDHQKTADDEKTEG